jgi:hypothetical protein
MVRFVTLFLLVSLAMPVSGQSPSAVPWANKFFQSESTPAVIVHDFGSVPSGTLLQHTFAITNIYDVPMQVVYVRKSCSCLEAYPPQGVIKPNEKAEFKISMDASKFKGPNSQTFHVTFGPNYVSTAAIQVRAVSRADVQLNPGTVSFGTVAQGSSPTQAVAVKYTGRQRDWKIIGAVEPTGPFDVMIEEGRWFNSDFKVTVKLKPDVAPGQIQNTLQLKTNDSASPIIAIPAMATVLAPLTVSPGKAVFGRVAVGQTATQRIMVRAAKPFTIEGLIDETSGITAEVTLVAPSPVQVLTLKFAPKVSGVLRAEIKLKTDLDGSLIIIPIEAEAIKP